MLTPNPRSRARSDIHGRLLAAHLVPGDRVGLPTLARKLGTSVTPVREACTQLSYSGLLGYAPNKGFWVTELSVSEARVLYNTVVALETEALRQIAPGAIDTARLRAINEDFAAAATPEARYRLDMDYHAALAMYYADTAVEQLLEDLKVRIYLYERAFLERAGNVEASVELHGRIADALDAGDVEAAVLALRQNWLNIDAVLSAAGLLTSEPSEA